jgi:hypothetical protein
VSAEPTGDRDQEQLSAWVANAVALTSANPHVAMCGRVVCRDGILVVWFRAGHVAHCGPLMSWN